MNSTYTEYVVKQILNISPDVTILTPYIENGHEYWLSASELGDTILAGIFDETEIEHGTGKIVSKRENTCGYLAITDDCDCYVLDYNGYLVAPTRYCPKCKIKMVALHAKEYDNNDYYVCSMCGHKEKRSFYDVLSTIEEIEKSLKENKEDANDSERASEHETAEGKREV